MAQSFPDFSHEILHSILVHVQPIDLAAISRTCSSLNFFLKDNSMLCKEMYIENWGQPLRTQDICCWVTEMRNVLELRRMLLSVEDINEKRDHLETSAKTILRLLSTSKATANEATIASWFASENQDSNIDSFLAASSLFKHAGTPSQAPAHTEELRQLSARLHCLYGVPIDAPSSSYQRKDSLDAQASFRILPPSRSIMKSAGPVTRSQLIEIPTSTYARSKVYDLRNYSTSNLFGPFKDNGVSVDWEKAEAIMVVLGYNLRMFRERSRIDVQPIWEAPWQGCTTNSFVSPEPKMAPELDAPDGLDEQDPYGISGTWMRVVCFLDYHDLYAFNFARPAPADGEPREPIDTREAIRMIKLKLKVTDIQPPGEDDGKQYPVVHFKGTSWSLHNSWDPNANSEIRGVVRQTPEGEIRWTTNSIFHGEERWRSEGIQVGGVRSSRGVLGNWFDKDYDVHGPAGPTAFWKISDSLSDEERPSNQPTYTFFGADIDSSDDESYDGDQEDVNV